VSFLRLALQGTGHTPEGYCQLFYEVSGYGTNNDANTAFNNDYYAIIEWVDFDSGSQPVAAASLVATKGEPFNYRSSFNLIGNNDLHMIKLKVYEMRSQGGGFSSLEDQVNYILTRNRGEVGSWAVNPRQYFNPGDCPPYIPSP
jgi:hypothetical protein